MGTRRMHSSARAYRPGSEDALRPFLLAYINQQGIIGPDVQLQLIHSRAGIPSDNGLALNPDHLTIVPPPPTHDGRPDGTRPGFRCPDCNAFFLHDAGICPECGKKLMRSSTTPDFDYYTDLTERESASYFRMHAEELTGQTDDTERPKRQRWFQDVFLKGEIRQVNGIDLLRACQATSS